MARLPNAIILSLKLMEHIEPNKPINRYIEVAVLIALVVLYGWASYERNLIWKDEMSLWTDVLKKSPHKARPHNLFGVALTNEGNYDKAIAEIATSLSISPNPIRYVALGNVYREKGLFDAAIAQYFKALSLKPDFHDVYVNIGNVYMKMGLLDRAMDEYRKTMQFNPTCLEAYINISAVYGLKRQYEDSLHYLSKALELDPDNPDAHYNLGVTYYSLGLFEKSISEYKKVLEMRPDDRQALYNLETLRSRNLGQGRIP